MIGGPSWPQEIGPGTRKSPGPDESSHQAAAAYNTKVETCRDFFLSGLIGDRYRDCLRECEPRADITVCGVGSRISTRSPLALVRNVRAGEQRDLTGTMRAREPVGMFVSSLRLNRSEFQSCTGSVSDKRAGAYSAGGRIRFWSQSAILRRVQ